MFKKYFDFSKLSDTQKLVIIWVLSLITFFFVISYVASLAFFSLNKLPLAGAKVFSIYDYWSAYHNTPNKSLRFTLLISIAIVPFAYAFIGFVALLNKNKRALHGAARFATLKEARNIGLVDPKEVDKTILVGKFKGNYLSFGGYQFVMLAAPTRSGKGVGVVIPNCLNYSDSLVVLDIKFENYNITSGFRAEHGQEVYLFAPFGRFNENEPIEKQKFKTHRWNPLDYVSTDPAARIQDIDAIATSIYTSKDEKDQFWNDQAKEMFRALCLMVLETNGIQHTLGEILRQSSGKGKPLQEHIKDMINKAVAEGHPYSDACTNALNRVINTSDNTFNNILSTFNSKLLIFANPRVDAATSASDFDLRQVRRKRMTIYLGISPADLGIASFIVNLFFNQLLNLNTRTLPEDDPSLKYQCLLIMDEFTSIGRVDMIQKSISYQAGYNMRVLTIIQNKSQLEDVYGKSGALTLMSNHALMVMYAPSPVVQSDANEYSEMLGYQTVKSMSKSRQHGRALSNSESVSDQKRALMMPQEIKELGRWKEIVSLENCKPIYCDKIKYFDDPSFTSRINHPVAPIPAVDMDGFLAKIETRFRAVNEDDVESENFNASHIVGDDDFILPQKIDLDIDALTPDDYTDIVDETADKIIESLVTSAAMDDEEASSVTDAIFGVSDDEEIMEIEETSNPESSEDNLLDSFAAMEAAFNEEVETAATENEENSEQDAALALFEQFGLLEDEDSEKEATPA